MDTKTILIIIACLSLVSIVVIMAMVNNTKKANFKKKIDDLYVRFNTIKTVPLAFKFQKAQAMAARSEETTAEVNGYRDKYLEAEKFLSTIQDKLNIIDDDILAKDYKDANELIGKANEDLIIAEGQIKEIDDYLEQFSIKEDQQREFSVDLKEKYRVVKNTINENAGILSVGYSGLETKLEQCEELFSNSEEAMFASDYQTAQVSLTSINDILEQIKVNANAIPKCIKDVKGVLPILIDEVKREYALTKQRGVYTDHLAIEEKIAGIESLINEDTKKLVSGEVDNIKENSAQSKKVLNDILDDLATENRSFKEAKETADKAIEHINDLQKVESYVRVAYDKDSKRFGLEDLKSMLKKQRDSIDKYNNEYKRIAEEIASCSSPASRLLAEAETLCDQIEEDKKNLYSYKTIIDKSTDGESRAVSQLTKLQLVVSEVEAKVAEYHLPNISGSYDVDLAKSREYISRIREIGNNVPINIDELNEVLDEAIDFIYKFYNNVNNIVGMAIMVENAIVFGNKYRSTFPEIDAELSKAELQYINGEFTKALKTAISCMETLFPDNADQKILESV